MASKNQEEEDGGEMKPKVKMDVDKLVIPVRRAEPPQWVLDLMRENDGTDLQFMMEKTLQQSDFSDQQSRLLIPAHHVLANFCPALSGEELEAANLHQHPENNEATTPTPSESDDSETLTSSEARAEPVRKMKKKAGRKHPGLDVVLYTRGRWKFSPILTKWDSKSTVLRGKEWKYARIWAGLQPKDRMEMWGFRDGRLKKLCLVVFKEEDKNPNA